MQSHRISCLCCSASIALELLISLLLHPVCLDLAMAERLLGGVGDTDTDVHLSFTKREASRS